MKELERIGPVERKAVKGDPYGNGRRFRGAGPGGDPRFDPNLRKPPFAGSGSKPRPERAGR